MVLRGSGVIPVIDLFIELGRYWMKAKRYVKDIILEVMGSKGCYARDLVDEVSRRVGKPCSVQRICSYLGLMYVTGEVRREVEEKRGSLKRYRWFRNTRVKR